MDNTFKFYLKAGSSGYYYVENNIILLSALKRPLEYDIVSWKDIEVSLTRVMDNWGVLREYTIDLSFIEDGKKIIDFIVANNPFVGELSLEIEKLNTATQTYALWAVCDIDLSTYSSDTIQATVNSKEGGLVALMRSRSNVEYTIDFASGAANIEVGNTRLGARARWNIGNTSKYSTSSTWEGGGANSHRFGSYVPQCFFLDNVSAGDFIRPYDQSISNLSGYMYINLFGTPPVSLDLGACKRYADTSSNGPTILNGRLIPLFRPFETWTSVDVSGKMTAIAQIGGGGLQPGIGWINAWVHILDLVTNVWRKIYLGRSNNIEIGIPQTFIIDIQGSIPSIGVNEICYFILTSDSNILFANYGVAYILPIEDCNIAFDYKASVPATVVRGFRYIDFITKFVEKMTDGAFTIQSSFLRDNFNNVRRAQNFDSKPRDVFVCSGDSLRGLSSAKITTTWDNILKDLWSLYGVIPSYRGNTIILEDMRTMLSNTVVFRTKSINNLNISAFREKVFNQVKVGQTASDTNNVVGRNEFNTQITFVVENNTLAEGVLDLSSPFRRDVYGIESARAEGFNRDKLDGQFDKDIFLIEVSSALNAWGRFTPYRVLGHISGVDDPNGVYNIPLSPKRCLMRNLRYIRSFFSSGMLNYVSTQKNPDLISNIRVPYNAIGNIIETADINLSLGTSNGNGLTPLFKPFVVEFDTDTDYNLVELTESNLNGIIEFDYNGNTFQGYILDIGVKPATRDTYRFRLLLHRDTDITKLQ